MERGANPLLPDECFVENIVLETLTTESTVPVSHVQLACNVQHCAFPLNGNKLCIWNLIAPHCQPLLLKGHHQHISAVTFGHGHNPILLCSASSDYIILWNLDECKEKDQQGFLPRGSIIGALLGMVLYLRFNPDDKIVAVCAERKVYLLSSEHEAVLAELEGHFGPVTAVEFLSWQTNLLVSVSEDRTFKVWDHCTESSLYQSSVLSASPLLSIYVDEENKQLVTGSADGQLWVFSLDQDHQYRCITRVDLQKEKHQFVNKLLSRQLEQPGENLNLPCKLSSMCDVNLENTDTALSVFKIEPMVSPINEDLPRFAKDARRVWLGSSTGLFLMNLENCEFEAVFHYGDFSNLSIQVVGSCAIACFSVNKAQFCGQNLLPIEPPS